MKIIVPYSLKLLSALLLSLLLASLVNATPQIMSAPDAQAAVKAGKMILLDIRTAEEWKEDGVAEGAYPLSLTDSDFGKNLNEILSDRGDKMLGMICATGGRTQYVMSVLDKNGLTDIVDVSEGMHGNHSGPGWLKRELPTVAADKALQDFENATK